MKDRQVYGARKRQTGVIRVLLWAGVLTMVVMAGLMTIWVTILPQISFGVSLKIMENYNFKCFINGLS